MGIEDYSQERAIQLGRWRRNRDHTSGSDAVKGAGETYLKRVDDEMTDVAYAKFLNMTEYFPAASQTLRSHEGLIFRKPPTLEAPEELKRLEPIIMKDTRSTEALSRYMFREFAITNDGGILIDAEPQPDGLNQAAKEAGGYEPYMITYTAESILDIRHGRRMGRTGITYVRLRDNPDLICERELIGGVYTVTTHTRVNGEWRVSRTIPRPDEPLNYVPFTWFCDRRDDGAMFDDLCANNLVHYAMTAALSEGIRWIVNPIRYVIGILDDVELETRAGIMWRFESPDAKVGFEEYKGQGIPLAMQQLDRIEKHLEALGLRMLSSDKGPAEAAETIARRQAGENSILAGAGRHVGGRIQSAFRDMAAWMGIDLKTVKTAVTFSLNADFIPNVIDPALLTQLANLNANGSLPDYDFFVALKKGEIIEEARTFEQWIDERETKVIDQPVMDDDGE